ncbi:MULTISPECIES: LuxR family transcriptional regulator [unclassified Bradyrhizobium]|uniref:helix-turn-helix transcriptional regulator n=1 Tax=unclassified Bradyrhizobium TaxID=2631580 RepID=UPI0029160F0B|nr:MULTISPECIES: LuxR family transcriptional regulator [unclassified Bradyrhizobium]
MDSNVVGKALRQIADCKSLGDVSKVLGEIREAYGISNIVYHAAYVPAEQLRNPILLSTFDDAWMRAYQERNYFTIDPVVVRGAKSRLPFEWSQFEHRTKTLHHQLRSARLYKDATHGLTIPICGTSGERALFTITSSARRLEWIERRLTYLRDFHCLAFFVHDRVATISQWRTRPFRDLSRRERQCLQLVAHGMAPKVIAGTIKVSESAVRLYMRSAREKLACMTTNQAIARSIELGLITGSGA